MQNDELSLSFCICTIFFVFFVPFVVNLSMVREATRVEYVPRVELAFDLFE
jgi:hypothetical protein